MATLSKALTPEKCQQLRESGILRTIIHQLHEHTLESLYQWEEDFNLTSFLLDFHRKSKKRQGLSRQLRTIVQHTAKDDSEVKILSLLEAVRAHTEQLYAAYDITKSIPEVPHKELTELIELTNDPKHRSIVELFGGVFVVLDQLRSFMRIPTDPESIQERSRHQLSYVFRILNNMLDLTEFDSPFNAKFFLGDCRSLHEHLVGVIKLAETNNDLLLVRHCCKFIYRISVGFINRPPHMRECGVLQCLTELFLRITEPETQFSVLQGLTSLLYFDDLNIREFLTIPGSTEMLIDVLRHTEEKDKDIENAEWYDKQRMKSADILWIIRGHPEGWAALELPETVGIFVDHLKQVDPTEFSLTTRSMIQVLEQILRYSTNQMQRFTEIENAKEIVKKFELSRDSCTSRWARKISELFIIE